MKNIFTLAVLTFIITSIITSDIFAIPAFARKYNMTCKTCHSPFPSLKPYGDEFAGNGFVLKDQDAPRYYVETGDPELSLIRDLPLAMRLDAHVTYNQNNSEQSDFSTPVLFKLLTGGAISKDVAYYVYYILENGERGKIEDAWLMFNDVFKSELDLTIGQFQLCDPLFKRELRLTRDDYYIYKVRPGNSQVDLTYDRGIMLQYGFETGTDLSLQIVNGSGIGEGFLDGNFDNDKYKNFMGRISQDVGEHLRIGTMGYWGKEQQKSPEGNFDERNELWMIGGDATISLDPIELNFQYIERQDGNPYFLTNGGMFFTNPPKDVKTRGAFAEMVYRPNGDDSKWYAVGLFNWIESDFSDLNYKTLSGHLGYVFRRNLRMVVETKYDFEREFVTLGIGVITAF
ncbi:MAG: hypothetical protein IT276_04415 [Ignavibacteriaceae bacterium]|nr:hypothetical protein [Ignavibacterium sp.]MCC6254133.1 hypothetical protein [Ignavibacteriaceae bacterium]HRN25472.1 hypothetical protein [Ignavibacteriaceae bacterium]HRQ52723.1 hypothetical protein [Ignavibacteriaceae bacterium]